MAFLFTLTDTRFAAAERSRVSAIRKALAAKQRPFRDNALAHREVLPFETPRHGSGRPEVNGNDHAHERTTRQDAPYQERRNALSGRARLAVPRAAEPRPAQLS